MFVIRIFNGIDDKILGPFDQQTAEREAHRLRLRRAQLGDRDAITTSITIRPLVNHYTLEAALRLP